MTSRLDLTGRVDDIPWPDGFDPKEADLFTHDEILVDASPERVWKHVVQASRWSEWYSNARNVVLPDGTTQLVAGTDWRWSTFGLSIGSTVHAYHPHRLLSWWGYVPGQQPEFYHVWYFRPAAAGCRVVIEEVGCGARARAFAAHDPGLMQRGHALWLAGLRWISEGPSPGD